MAFFVEGYKKKKLPNLALQMISFSPLIIYLYPFTKRAITPMSFEQIEKFQCLSLSTAQGPAHGSLRSHVARVTCPETCPKVCQL